MDLGGLWTAPFPTDLTPAILNAPGQDLYELDFYAEDNVQEPCLSSGSATDTPLPLRSDSSSAYLTIAENKGRRKPMPRKGHKKSRRGCYSCKRRKIKCPETTPCCEHCVKAGIQCEYPKLPDNQLVLASPTAPLSNSPTSFSINDMRFFHHFIVKGYPHLPVGADHTWTMEIPAIAHEVSQIP
jgi:hypothetical protein